MRYFQIFLPFTAVLSAAWAQPPAAPNVLDPTALEQRRAELRSVLKTPRAGEPQEKVLVVESQITQRHLSEQEKVDLRRQLRQQKRDAKRERP